MTEQRVTLVLKITKTIKPTGWNSQTRPDPLGAISRVFNDLRVLGWTADTVVQQIEDVTPVPPPAGR
jgi:hypothetical protein